MTDNLESISQIHWNGGSAKVSGKPTKDAAGNITGSFATDAAGLKVLLSLVGKKDMTGTSGMKVTIQPQNEIITAPATVILKERQQTVTPTPVKKD